MKPLAADMDEFLQPEAARWMKLLITWKETDSCCDLQQASRDTQKLLALGMGVSYGQEGPVIASLLKTRCSSHMRNVFGELRRLGNSPYKMLESAIPHDIKKRINCVLQAIDNPELLNAKALWFTRGEPGRFWRNVLSVRLSRSKEFYKKVEFLFNEQYNVRIQDEIKKDTGDSITFLLKRILKF